MKRKAIWKHVESREQLWTIANSEAKQCRVLGRASRGQLWLCEYAPFGGRYDTRTTRHSTRLFKHKPTLPRDINPNHVGQKCRVMLNGNPVAARLLTYSKDRARVKIRTLPKDRGFRKCWVRDDVWEWRRVRWPRIFTGWISTYNIIHIGGDEC